MRRLSLTSVDCLSENSKDLSYLYDYRTNTHCTVAYSTTSSTYQKQPALTKVTECSEMSMLSMFEDAESLVQETYFLGK